MHLLALIRLMYDAQITGTATVVVTIHDKIGYGMTLDESAQFTILTYLLMRKQVTKS